VAGLSVSNITGDQSSNRYPVLTLILRTFFLLVGRGRKTPVVSTHLNETVCYAANRTD
jgi:hypothetical protein